VLVFFTGQGRTACLSGARVAWEALVEGVHLPAKPETYAWFLKLMSSLIQ
jgi:hypothetical protein